MQAAIYMAPGVPPLHSVDTVPVALTCAGIPPNICAEEGRYESLAVLAPIAGGYTLVYQRCCRSSIIGNLSNPLSQGMSVTATIPDSSLATNNSSPAYSNYPPTAFCVSFPINYDPSATDPDGNSLVYEICTVIAGADDLNPYPFPPLAPPYPPVIYLPPFSGAFPYDASPALAIDGASGLITGTPSSIGVFTLAVCVSEYRNVVLIGNHRREMAEVYTVAQLPVGINNTNGNLKATILPVPASTELRIIPGISEKFKEVRIIDASGKMVLREQVIDAFPAITISLSDFDNGNYFIQLLNEHSIETQPFIISR